MKDNGNQLIGKGRYLEAYAEYHKAFAVLERSSHINPVNTYSSRVLLIATIYSNLSLVQLHMKDYLGAFEVPYFCCTCFGGGTSIQSLP